jgi:hypothetical protein
MMIPATNRPTVVVFASVLAGDVKYPAVFSSIRTSGSRSAIRAAIYPLISQKQLPSWSISSVALGKFTLAALTQTSFPTDLRILSAHAGQSSPCK